MSYFEKLYVHKYENIIINAPVQLMESAIIKDTVDKKIYLRNIFTNVGSQTIIAIILEGKLYDITGELISEDSGKFSYTYQDIKVGSNDLFGNKIPIALPNNVRKIEVFINKVVTESGDVISYSGMKNITPISPDYIKIADEFLDTLDSFKQPPIIYPLINDDYWQCTCGRINWNKERICGLCSRSISDQSIYEKDNLQSAYEDYVEKCNKRIAEEEKKREIEKEREKQEKIRREREKQQEEIRQQEIKLQGRKKLKKTIVISACGLILIVAGVAAYKIYEAKVIIPKRQYDEAIALMNDQKYEEAKEAFEVLGDYNDSQKKIDEIDEISEEIKEKEAQERTKKEIESKYQNIIEEVDSRDFSAAIENISYIEDIEKKNQLIDYTVEGLIKTYEETTTYAVLCDLHENSIDLLKVTNDEQSERIIDVNDRMSIKSGLRENLNTDCFDLLIDKEKYISDVETVKDIIRYVNSLTTGKNLDNYNHKLFWMELSYGFSSNNVILHYHCNDYTNENVIVTDKTLYVLPYSSEDIRFIDKDSGMVYVINDDLELSTINNMDETEPLKVFTNIEF